MKVKEKDHECDLNEIKWGEKPIYGGGDEGLHFEGECPECGKKFEMVYSFTGIWDPEKRDYVYANPEL